MAPKVASAVVACGYEHLDHITGLAERVTFHNSETGFAVLRVKVSGQQNLVTVIGTLPSIIAGEWLDARRRWDVDPDHGRQFRAELLRISHPNTVEGSPKSAIVFEMMNAFSLPPFHPD